MNISSRFALLLFFLCPAFLLSQSEVQEDGDAINKTQSPSAIVQHENIFRSNESTTSTGDEVEGDFIGQMAFTPDGSQVWCPNRQTANVTVIDFETQAIVANLSVGATPTGVAMTDQYAIVPCLSSNEIHIFQLDDYEEAAAVIEAPDGPAKVIISPQGDKAAVACDDSDVVVVIDLSTLQITQTITGFPCYISKFSFITSNTRNTVYWNDFAFTPDGQQLVASTETGLQFFDIATGTVVTNISEIPETSFLGVSQDGNKLIAASSGTVSTFYQVDLTTQTLEDTLSYGGNLFTTYSPMAVNTDGSKAFTSASGNQALLVDFDAGTATPANTTSSPNWVGTTPDGQYAVSGQFYLTLVNFETGEAVQQTSGTPIQNGALSPSGNRIVATDPLRYEALDFYVYEAETGFTRLGRQNTGSVLEGDVAYSVTLSPDEETAVVANSLSGTLSVIASESLQAIIPLGTSETYQVDITPDGDYALVAKRLENTVDIVSLQTYEVVQTLNSGGSKPDQVFVLPDGEHAYVINSGGVDAIGLIELDGANSSLVKTFASGNTGISWTNYGIRCNLAFTPDGQYAVLATPFDDAIQIIDTELHEIVASVAVEGFPLQVAVSGPTMFGVFAAVTLKNADEIALISAVGPDAGLFDTYPCGDNPVRVAYDPENKRFAVCAMGDGIVNYFDLETLAFTESQNYNPTHEPIAIQYGSEGNLQLEYTLLRSKEDGVPHQLRMGDQLFDLPALPIHHMDVAKIGWQAAVPLLSTDELFVVRSVQPGVESLLLPLSAPSTYRVHPLPARAQAHLVWSGGTKPSSPTINCEVFSLDGVRWRTYTELPTLAFDLEVEDWPAGSYFYRISAEGQLWATGQLIKQ